MFLTHRIGIHDEGSADVRRIRLVPKTKGDEEDALVGNVVFGGVNGVTQIVARFRRL
jgi:hypothetical protein